MEFELKQFIIHELIKEADSAEAQLYISDEAMPIDERSLTLIEQLNLTFEQKSDTLQGYLSSPEDALFPGYFQELADQTFGVEAFLQFSKETMQALQLSLQGVTGAKGGYLVYSLYRFFGNDFFAIFLIRDTEGIIFRKEEAATRFAIDDVTYLDTEKLAMAGRINITHFNAGNQRCLELIKYAKSQKSISEYFQNWIGLDRPESSKSLTHNFLEVVNELPLPLKEDSNEKMEEAEFRSEVLNFAMKNPHKTISIEQFDKTFYGDTGTAQKVIEEQGIELEDTFRFDQGAMKNYYHYRASAEGLSLSFNHSHYKKHQIEIEGDAIVIRSEALVEKILAQLEEYL
ncbi:MAG: nucleoid-associated protein [Bacteroidota bacterium]